MRYDFDSDAKRTIITNVVQELPDVYANSDVRIAQRRSNSLISEVWEAQISRGTHRQL